MIIIYVKHLTQNSCIISVAIVITIMSIAYFL